MGSFLGCLCSFADIYKSVRHVLVADWLQPGKKFILPKSEHLVPMALLTFIQINFYRCCFMK